MIEVRDIKTGELYGVYYGILRNQEKHQVFAKLLYSSPYPMTVETDAKMVMERAHAELGSIRHRNKYEYPVLYVEHHTTMHDVRNYVDLGKLIRF